MCANLDTPGTRSAHPVTRRLPVGAEPQAAGVHFRVWAPDRERVEVVIEGRRESTPLSRERGGYYSGLAAGLPGGTRYRYRLDAGDAFPDPASRFQPEGPHGPSEVVDPGRFAWTDRDWPGVRREGQVLYELHVGGFTPEGTWAAAARELPALAELGITLIEVMPVADFPGRFGWGYDGVDLFAPTRLYGRPDDFRGFVDRAHALGLGVLLDVVYNHLGPDGNYLGQYARGYVTGRHATPWGPAPNYDGPDAGPVRELVLANAGYWIDEFHLDGLRLDATHAIHDDSPEHILAAIGRTVRERGGRRSTLVFAEDEPQRVALALPLTAGGMGLDGIWNDDFHHTARVAATGRREGYYRHYLGSADELLAVTQGTLAAPGALAPSRLVTFLENHDQIAHSARGLRLNALTSPGRWRALTALLLLSPGTPLLFMGQEFGATSPFQFFADHEPELADLVRQGRAKHLAQFESVADPAMQALLPDPASPRTFARSCLDPAERSRHRETLALHRDLLALRRTDPAFAAQQAPHGRALAATALALRFARNDGLDRLLLLNLGPDLAPGPEPALFEPAAEGAWRLIWSSDDPRYGGSGTPAGAREGRLMPAESALVLAATRRS
ncbi:MAG: malto-oligosyltrehalose trehalohydrolase [Deltaproteobacteria bacterium]